MPKPLPPKVAKQRHAVVESIIRDLDNNSLRWLQEWGAGSLPQNITTGNAYRGINRLNLSMISRIRGFTDPRFVTFRQAQEHGWTIKKGAKSYAVEKWKQFLIPNLDPDVDPRLVVRCVGYYNVFNCCEVEGVDPWEPDLTPIQQSPVLDVADTLIKSSRCPIKETDVGRACYSPMTDTITIPDRRLFLGSDDVRAQSFIRTLSHEMVHSTMRPLHRAHEDYAKEECVAEVGAVFITSSLNVPIIYSTSDLHYSQHVAYIQSWAKHFRDKPQMIYTCATLADAAANYIINRYNELS